MTEATPGRCAWRSCCASFVLNPFFASTLPRARLDVTRSPEPLLSQGLEGVGRVPPPLCLLAPDLRRLSALCLSEGTLSRRTSRSSQRPLWHGGSDGVATVQEAPLSSCLQRLVISCSVYSVSTLDFMSSRERVFSQKKGRPTKPGERAGWAHAWLLCGLRKFGKATASAAKVGGQSVPQSPGNEPAWPRVLPASPAGDGHGVCGLRGGVAALRR